MPEQTPPDDRTTRPKQARRTVLVLAMMVGAVVLAWSAGKVVEMVLVSGYRQAAAPHRPGPATRPDEGVGDAASPLAAAGLSAFAGDPAGVAPPTGSRRIFGVQRVGEDEIERQVRYSATVSADETAAHYEKVFGALGYRRMRDAAAAGQRRVLVFSKADSWATVSLLMDPQNVKMTNVVVVAVTPIAPKR